MNTGISAFDYAHQFGDPATHPITCLPSRLAALLLLAGNDHARRRALPAGSAGTHSGVLNRGIKVEFPASGRICPEHTFPRMTDDCLDRISL